MSSLGVIPDGISSSHSDPLGDGAVLLDLLSQNALELETLDSSLEIKLSQQKEKRGRMTYDHGSKWMR